MGWIACQGFFMGSMPRCTITSFLTQTLVMKMCFNKDGGVKECYSMDHPRKGRLSETRISRQDQKKRAATPLSSSYLFGV